MTTFKDKLQSLQFARGSTKVVRKDGHDLGETYTSYDGKVSSTVTPKVHVIDSRGQ